MKNETKLKPAHLLSNLGNRTDFQDVVTIVELNVTTILSMLPVLLLHNKDPIDIFSSVRFLE